MRSTLAPPSFSAPLQEVGDETVYYLRPLLRHVVEVLDGECPICGGRLETGRGQIAGRRVRAGRCQRCRLDYTAEEELVPEGRLWRLTLAERPLCESDGES